jgi:hypothetical protein
VSFSSPPKTLGHSLNARPTEQPLVGACERPRIEEVANDIAARVACQTIAIDRPRFETVRSLRSWNQMLVKLASGSPRLSGPGSARNKRSLVTRRRRLSSLAMFIMMSAYCSRSAWYTR